jgi:dihydroxyacetone kinase
VALLVNGLGGTPPMELAIIARHALACLRAEGLTVERAWCGNLLTALEMPGCSLTVMRVNDTALRRLDAGVGAPAWPGSGVIPAARAVIRDEPVVIEAESGRADPGLRARALAVAAALEAAEEMLTALDTVAGDGDLGISLARGAAAIRRLPDHAWADPISALTQTAGALRQAIAGSSGPFYAVGLLRAASHLSTEAAAEDWARAFRAGVDAISELGGAKPGDRTMLDALHPAAEAFAAALAEGRAPWDAWAAAVAAAETGVAATRDMHPALGRASYLGARVIGHPDAGASAVAVWLRAVGTAARR